MFWHQPLCFEGVFILFIYVWHKPMMVVLRDQSWLKSISKVVKNYKSFLRPP
jgi:hypothetical protein